MFMAQSLSPQHHWKSQRHPRERVLEVTGEHLHHLTSQALKSWHLLLHLLPLLWSHDLTCLVPGGASSRAQPLSLWALFLFTNSSLYLFCFSKLQPSPSYLSERSAVAYIISLLTEGSATAAAHLGCLLSSSLCLQKERVGFSFIFVS